MREEIKQKLLELYDDKKIREKIDNLKTIEDYKNFAKEFKLEANDEEITELFNSANKIAFLKEDADEASGGKDYNVVQDDQGNFLCPVCGRWLNPTGVQREASCGKGYYFLYGCGGCNKFFRRYNAVGRWTDD